MSTIDVNWGTLLSTHPTGTTFHKLVPGWPADWETCCAKLSYAFNATDDPIANYAYPDKSSPTGKARAMSIAGENYLLAVHDVRAYLSSKYGEPERYGSKAEIVGATQSRVGVIAFGLRHVDLWVNGNIHYPAIYNLGYLWDKSHWGSEMLMFWEVGQDDDDDDD